LTDLGPRGEDIKRILRTSASIVDAMGTLRNRASLAHPNEDILDRDEALLVINVGRSLLRFLDSKLGMEQSAVPNSTPELDLGANYGDDDLDF
jgi:hypothetical protein